MKIAAALAAVASATITWNADFVAADDVVVLSFTSDASPAQEDLSFWVRAGTDAEDVEGWYQFSQGQNNNAAAWAPANTSAAQYAAEWGILQYAADEDAEEGTNPAQNFWQIVYESDTNATEFTDPPTMVQLFLASGFLLADDPEEDYSADAEEDDSAYAYVLSSYTEAIWDDSAEDYPDTTIYRLQPDETDTTGVRIELETAFTAWYSVSDYESTATAVTVTSADLVAANSEDGTWVAASSLTASAACVVLAASLF